MTLVSDTGKREPSFDVAVVNRNGTSTGQLALSDASAAGSGDEVLIFEVTFQVVGSPLSTTVLDLELPLRSRTIAG